jgi:hypothetical protein
MDLVIIVVLLVLVVLISRRFTNLIYFIAIIDIFLRIIDFINCSIPVKEINNILSNIPISIPDVIYKYSSGFIANFLIWGLVACYIIFEYYVIKTLFKRKR